MAANKVQSPAASGASGYSFLRVWFIGSSFLGLFINEAMRGPVIRGARDARAHTRKGKRYANKNWKFATSINVY